MTGKDILVALGQVEEKFLEEIEIEYKKKKKNRMDKKLVLAASLCILVISSLFLARNQIDQILSRKNPNRVQTHLLAGNDEKTKNLPKLKIAHNAGDGFGFAGLMAYRIEELEEANPWKEEMKIDRLPVFTNKYRFKRDTFIVSGYTVDEMVRDLSEIVKKYGIDFDKEKIRISRYDEYEKISQEERENLAESISYESEDYIFEVARTGSVRVTFKKAEIIEGFKTEKGENSEDVLKRMGQAFIKNYPDRLNTENPRIRITKGGYDYEGGKNLFLEIYNGWGEKKEEFLQYHLGSCMRIFLGKDKRLHYIDYFNSSVGEKIGDYPLISPQEARQKMKEGAFVTSVPYPFPGVDKIAKIELVYWKSSLEPYLIPYYEVYVELEEEDLELEKGLKTFGLYYVPAVKEEYIENMPTYQGEFN